MTLALASRIVSDVVILDVSGKLRFCETSLFEKINALLKEGHRRFLINLAETSYIDGFGLGQLISVWTLVRKKGGNVALLRPSTRVSKLLEITKLNTVFQIVRDEADIIEDVSQALAVSA